MLYNIEKKRVKKDIDCYSCEKYDARMKKCNGCNSICFEYDSLTNTIIDGITKMPIKNKEQ